MHSCSPRRTKLPRSRQAEAQMIEDGRGCVRSAKPEEPASARMWFQRFLRTDSTWSKPAWVFFCCALVVCRMQAVPSWTHPSLRLGWNSSVFYWLIAFSGAITGVLVAQYRVAGLVAGALAGSGSLLAAAVVLERINPYSRIVDVTVQVIGLLPGVAVYCVLHLVIDRFIADSKVMRGIPSADE
jgi:hypothetical protein